MTSVTFLQTPIEVIVCNIALQDLAGSSVSLGITYHREMSKFNVFNVIVQLLNVQPSTNTFTAFQQ